MKKNLKILLFTCMVALVLITIPSTTVNAGLQANPNTHYKLISYAIDTWMLNARKMETLGEVMGLNETIDSTTLLPTSESNNIDVHMMKDTEYGAIAILSASAYGNPQTLQASATKTTTGNKTGIYYSGVNYEWLAGGASNTMFTGKNTRYYDSYTTASIASARAGDALGNASTANPGATGWHSSGASVWIVSAQRILFF